VLLSQSIPLRRVVLLEPNKKPIIVPVKETVPRPKSLIFSSGPEEVKPRQTAILPATEIQKLTNSPKSHKRPVPHDEIMKMPGSSVDEDTTSGDTGSISSSSSPPNNVKNASSDDGRKSNMVAALGVPVLPMGTELRNFSAGLNNSFSIANNTTGQVSNIAPVATYGTPPAKPRLFTPASADPKSGKMKTFRVLYISSNS